MADYYVDEKGIVRKKKKQEQKQEKNLAPTQSKYVIDETGKIRSVDELAPVKSSEKRTWFSGGAFKDGYQFGDVTKTILGTVQDASENVATGVLGMGEKVVDAGAYGVGLIGGLFDKDFKKKTGEFIAKDLYDEAALAKKVAPNTGALGWVAKILTGDNADENSVLGEKADSLAQSGGQLIGTMGLQAAGVPWWLTSGVTSFGGTAEQALNEGASFDQAGLSAAISAGAEILTEKLFGGSGLGEKGLINVDKFTKGVASKVVKSLLDFGIDIGGESFEEVASSFISRLGNQLTYEKEATWAELLSNEDAMNAYINQMGKALFGKEAREEYLESAIGGAALGGVMNTGKVAGSVKSGEDYRSGLTKNEQKVFDKLYEERVSKAQKGGKTLSKKDQAKIYDEVMKDIEKGNIPTDTIEEILGEESFKGYNDLKAEADEFKTLYETKSGDLSEAQRDRLTELKAKNTETSFDELLKAERDNISKSVLDTLAKDRKGKGSKLFESYNEKARRGQAFEADLSTYKDEKQRNIIKKAVESGILNNTRRTHEFVDMIAKISADKGVLFDFTNNERLKESGFAKDGRVVNGYVTKDGITVNLNSAKSLNSVVGHEITHVLEGTELYSEMQKAIFEYAKGKKDFDGRRKTLEDLYKDVKDADVDAELAADLVGDYLFTDEDFIRHLSSQNRNVFQKIFDEIKYLCKVATAGSKEARQLEEVKRKFEKAYRESAKTKKSSDNTKFSISEEFNGEIDRWDGKTIGFSFVVGETSNALQEAGIPKKQIRWDASKVATLLKKHSGMTRDIIKQIPGLLENPIIVVDSKSNKNAKVVMGDLYDVNGKIVTAVLLLTPTSKKGNVLDLVKISSAEGRGHIKSLFTNEDGTNVPVRYVDKKRIQSWLNVNRLQLPLHNLDLDSKYSISQNSEKSRENAKFSISDKNIKDISTGYAYGETYYTMSYTQDGKVVGTLEYGEYDGEPNVKMVQVDPEYRRKGIATKLLQELQNKYPGVEIDFGMTTPDGTKLLESITYDVTDEAIVADRQRLKDLQTELNDLQGKLDSLYELVDAGKDLTQAQENELDELGDRWQEAYESTRELEKSLQWKKATKTFVKTESNPDTRFSLSKADNEYLDAVNKGDTETAQRMVEEVAKQTGYAVRAYHGTRRGDRVGNVFLPERATSGPMAFFTDSKEIAENYAKSKQDTSMAYDPDFDRYETQFRIKTKYTNQDVPLYMAWRMLPLDARNRITEKAGQLREDWDGDNELILDPDTNEANGGFQWQLKEARGNTIQALTEQWLNSGNLFNEEARFLDVLEMSGVTEEFKKIGMDSLYFKDPNARHEKVYDTFLKITNPFDTSKASEQFADELEAWYEDQDQTQYERESMQSDLWDKNGIDAYDFAERLRRDVENGTTHAWTSIPDSVTDYLKSLGYDGIKDAGGKNGGDLHTVWIPFSSEQVKSAEPITYDDNGNVIPLSERFKESNVDIRYSLSGEGEAPKRFGNYNVKGEEISLDIGPVREDIAKNATTTETTVSETENMAPLPNFAPMREDIAGGKESENKNAPVSEAIENTTENTVENVAPPREAKNGEAKTEKTKEETPKGKRRKWTKTSVESDAVDGRILFEDLDQEKVHYEPISNKKTLGNANARLESMGYEAAVSYFNSQFANKKVSLDDVVLGERLVQEALNRGDNATAGELIQNVAILGTELGQKVQALSIIKRLTPEGQLGLLKKTIERGKTKGDKAYEGVELTQEMIDHILKTYGKDGTFDQKKLNEAVEDVKQKIADQMKVSKMDKVNAWRYLSMLGNPKTHIRNLVSNVAMKGTVSVKNALARTIETIAPIKNRTKTWKAASEDVKKFAQQTTEEMKDILQDGDKYNEDASIKAKRATFKNKLLNGVYEFNSDLLSKEDWWFSKPAFKNALSEYLTANGINTAEDIKNNPQIIEKAKAYATEQSQIATFRQYSWLSNKINEIEHKNAATQIAVGAVLPFKKTPINIAKTALAYSPLGFAKTLTYDISQVKQGKMEASELVDHLSQNVTGSALTLIGYMLAQAGFLNGAGEDDKEGEYDYQLGEQSYSINIGGATYSLSWLSPVAMPLFVGTNAYEQLVEGKEWNGDVVVQTLAQTLDPLSEMSFLSGLNQVLSSYEGGMAKFAGIGQSAAQNYITQFVPTLSSQIATVMDDTKRSTKVAADSEFKFFDETINQLKYKIPWLRQTLEPSTDIWGNEVKQTENLVTRAVETFLAPYSKRDKITTKIDEEIKALYKETGDDGLIPNIPNNYINYDGQKYKMSAKDFTAYKKTYGQLSFDLLSSLLDTHTYQSSTSEERAEMVNKVYDYARDEAKREYFVKFGVDFTNATKDKVEYYKENSIKGAIENDMTIDEYEFFSDHPEKYAVAKSVGGYKAYKVYSSELSDIKADKDANGESIAGSRKKKVIEYINNLDADYETKIILYRAEYTSDNRYNYEIISYLNSREDISYADMESILKQLGFKVDSKGNISW